MNSVRILADLGNERIRQKEVEGFSIEHDDQHKDGSLAEAAAYYTSAAVAQARGFGEQVKNCPDGWPWNPDDWNPKDQRRNLVRAGALIIAEIERIDRAAERTAVEMDT